MLNPIRRIRDQVRHFKPQQAISYQEWTTITDKALQAQAFINPENPVYMSLRHKLEEAENEVMIGVREVREETLITETFKRIFVTPRDVHFDELAGKIKIISSFLLEIQSWIDVKKDLEKQEAEGKVIIFRNEKEDATK